MYTFKITSISTLEPFETEQQVWILAEKGTRLTVERMNSTRTKKREFEIPDELFENNTYRIGNCEVSKFLLSATKEEVNNLRITINSISNKEHIEPLNFSEPDSIVEILQDKETFERIIQMDKQEEIMSEIARLLKFDKKKFKDGDETTYSNQIYVILQTIFDYQKDKLNFRNFDGWTENKNVIEELKYIKEQLEKVKVEENSLSEHERNKERIFKIE